MGHRLSKIYTRTGDDGSTGLGDGSRVAKNHPRLAAYGDIDELNSAIGLLLSEPLPRDVAGPLTEVQHQLFDLGGELSIPGHALITAAQVRNLEEILDQLNDPLPPLKEFVLPGGSRAAALCHLARAVCRRAERRTVALADGGAVSGHALHYLNRLSDLLFVMARHLNRAADHDEVLWRRE